MLSASVSRPSLAASLVAFNKPTPEHDRATSTNLFDDKVPSNENKQCLPIPLTTMSYSMKADTAKSWVPISLRTTLHRHIPSLEEPRIHSMFDRTRCIYYHFDILNRRYSYPRTDGNKRSTATGNS